MRESLIFLLFVLNGFQTAIADSNSLKIFTWDDYFDPELISLFEQQTGITVEMIYYDNDEVRDQIMAETTGFGFDVILVDDVELESYITQNWIAPIDYAKLSNLQTHGDEWIRAVPNAKGYAIPYGWGTYGIAYRTDLLTTPPKRWADLFNPSPELSGFIQMPPQASELLMIALMAQGDSANETSKEALNKALQALTAQKPHVSAYKAIDPDDNLLDQGISKAVVTYNSDAILLQDEFDNIGFVTPKEGTILWIDYWTLSAQSHKTKEALLFFDFLLDPVNNAKNIEYQYTATFSETAKKLLPEEILNNDIVFPPFAKNLETKQAPNRASVRIMMKIINSLGIE